LNAENVLVSSGPEGILVTGFVDVENGAAWSPEIDFAKFLDFTCTSYPALRQGLIQGYSEFYGADFASLIPERRLDLFETLLDLRVLVDMAHSYVGATIQNIVRNQHLPLLHFQRLFALLDQA